MHMKRQWVFSLLIVLLFARPGAAVSNIPYNVTLTATDTTITVDWSGDTEADGYYVYYGTTSGNLDNKMTVTGTATIETITDLIPGTTYYVAVSSYDEDGESNRSTVQSIATTKDVAKPATPTGLDITSVQSITESSVVLKWNRNSESDLDYYNIYYGTTSGSTDMVLTAQDAAASSFTVSGLTASTRYYFSVSAVDAAGNESDISRSLIVDTLTDTLPPNPPARVSGYLSDIREITITIADGNEQMADFEGHVLFYGTTSGSLDHEVDLGNASTYTLTDLTENATWYFSALSYDSHGNDSQRTPEGSAVVEETRKFLDDADFDGGCFIASAAESPDKYVPIGEIPEPEPEPEKSPADEPAACAADGLGRNIMGLLAAWYVPVESDFEDFYGDRVLLVSGFYERLLTDWLSMAVETGFMKEKGSLLTASGAETGIGTDLTLAPLAVSLNVYHAFAPSVVGYAGAGLDYWYCQEETDAEDVYPEIEEWVGGCHGKLGVKLYNMDPTYRNTGAILETSYSWIDRFGGNNTDIGGWAFKFGLFYQF